MLEREEEEEEEEDLDGVFANIEYARSTHLAMLLLPLNGSRDAVAQRLCDQINNLSPHTSWCRDEELALDIHVML